jgi:hypothetical protein
MLTFPTPELPTSPMLPQQSNMINLSPTLRTPPPSPPPHIPLRSSDDSLPPLPESPKTQRNVLRRNKVLHNNPNKGKNNEQVNANNTRRSLSLFSSNSDRLSFFERAKSLTKRARDRHSTAFENSPPTDPATQYSEIKKTKWKRMSGYLSSTTSRR